MIRLITLLLALVVTGPAWSQGLGNPAALNEPAAGPGFMVFP